MPIFVGKSAEYYHDIVNKVNGILLPGGGVTLTGKGYGRAATHLLNLTIELNEKNATHFPLWATCLSFEKLISYALNDDITWMRKCNVENVALPLTIVANETRLFAENVTFSGEIVRRVTEHNVTANYHRICLDAEVFHNRSLDKDFRLVSTSNHSGHTFVSTIEHRRVPIYATQWHPEKALFEFVVGQHVGNIAHDESAVLVAQYMANFLINEARRNKHRFPDKKQELDSLIYNYQANLRYTGKKGDSSFEEIYVFSNSHTALKPAHWFVLGHCLLIVLVTCLLTVC